jgi:HD superfamily phosphohydrolase
VGKEMFLALNRRALYAFDDFLLARHHMNLMVYFHHKAIIFEEMLMRYMKSKDCNYRLPADIEEYVDYTDYGLYQHLATQKNEWASRITERRIYRVLFELHTTAQEKGIRSKKMQKALESAGIPVIFASSSIRLSKYHGGNSIEKNFPIFVVDHYDRLAKPYPIEETTEIFHKYDEIRRIERLYVPPELHAKAEKILVKEKL